MKIKDNKGFTLIELLLVILIIIGLAAIVVPNYMKVSDDSNTAVDAANRESLKAALRLMVLDGGLAAVSGAATLNTSAFTSGAPSLASYDLTIYVHGPYVESLPVSSPLGTVYSIAVSGTTGVIAITAP